MFPQKDECPFVVSCMQFHSDNSFIWSMLDGRITRWLWVPVVEIKEWKGDVIMEAMIVAA